MVTFTSPPTSTNKSTKPEVAPDTNLGYKKMKKMMMTLLVMTCMAMHSYAQFYDYATQVIINAQQRWAIQDRLTWMQFQQGMNQAAQQIQWQTWQNMSNWQQVPNNGYSNWTMPTTNNYYVSQAPTQSMPMTESKDNRCSNCLGRGFNPKTMYMGNGNVITTKIRCAFCHGNGTR